MTVPVDLFASLSRHIRSTSPFAGPNVIVEIDHTEALLSAKERIRRETFRPGDRIRAYVLDVLPAPADGSQILLSRMTSDFVARLLAEVVPEVASGQVVIEAVARLPGAHCKVAVSSRDPGIDSIAACVGMGGSRVRAVADELDGERIDLVAFDRDPVRFVCNALRPVRVTRVVLYEDNRSMELFVRDEDVPLALGRGGANVRLASQLAGWTLTVRSESEAKSAAPPPG